MMRVFAISDLHGHFPPWVPECELLLLGGDYCPTRNLEQERRFILGKFKDWLANVPAKYIVAIAGNHDFIFQEEPHIAQELKEYLPNNNFHYLKDEEVNIEGVRIYGTPWTKQFYDWAFMEHESKLAERYANIPTGLDILLTHGPAFRCLDKNAAHEHCGSAALHYRINEVKPDTVICGHIHEAHGVMDADGVRYFNVAYVNSRNEPKYNCVSIPLKAE